MDIYNECESVDIIWDDIYNGDTMKILETKHTHMSPPSMSTTMFSKAPLVVEALLFLVSIWRQVVTRVVMKVDSNDGEKYFNDF